MLSVLGGVCLLFYQPFSVYVSQPEKTKQLGPLGLGFLDQIRLHSGKETELIRIKSYYMVSKLAFVQSSFASLTQELLMHPKPMTSPKVLVEILRFCLEVVNGTNRLRGWHMHFFLLKFTWGMRY